MTITEEERQQIVAEEEAKRKRELSDRMRRLGKSRSAKKMAAVRKNLEKAHLKKHGRKIRVAAGPRRPR